MCEAKLYRFRALAGGAGRGARCARPARRAAWKTITPPRNTAACLYVWYNPPAMTDPLPERASARLILVHLPTRAMLWLAVRDPFMIARVPAGCVCWTTPGGGVDPGESFARTAVRELWEETGLVAGADALIGEPLFERRRVVPWGTLDAPTRMLSVEQWFPVTLRVGRDAVSDANLLPYEKLGITAYRFWTADEMRDAAARQTDAFFPDDLAAALDDWQGA